jgi:hypothetical protein
MVGPMPVEGNAGGILMLWMIRKCERMLCLCLAHLAFDFRWALMTICIQLICSVK